MKKWKQLANSVLWKLVVIYILLLIMALQLIGVYFFRELEAQLTQDVRNDLATRATIIEEKTEYILGTSHSDEAIINELKPILDSLNLLNTRDSSSSPIVAHVIDQNNFIIASTSSKQNEIRKTLLTMPNQSKDEGSFYKRRDAATGKDYQIYTRPLKYQGKYVGAIYMETSLEKTYQSIKKISKILIQIAAVALVITSLLVIIIARTITSPVQEITKQATAMADGDFNRHVNVKSEDEIGRLAMAFNHLASQLRLALAEKEEEKEKLESVLANMSDGVIATDSTGRIIVRNQWAEKLLESPIQIGDSLTNVLPLTKEMKIPLTKQRQTFFELHENDPEAYTIIRVSFTPIKLKGDEKGTVVVLQDITEQEKLDRQRKEFVANVSHELRTPLTTIKSYLEALEDGAVEEPELATRFLKVTRQEADRMTRLIQDLLHLSRLDANKAKFQKKTLAIDEILEETMDRFSFQCKQKNISATLFIHGSLPFVYADRDKIHQVLDNLVSNAVKYTPEGGSIAIVAQKTNNGMVEIGIADTGIGIPKKDLGRIFERFYRVDKARSRSMGGTGLGLAISREIIRIHEGEIAIDSKYKKGTLVTFTLPSVSRR